MLERTLKRETWLYAGTSEYPAILSRDFGSKYCFQNPCRVKIRPVRTIRREDLKGNAMAKKTITLEGRLESCVPKDGQEYFLRFGGNVNGEKLHGWRSARMQSTVVFESWLMEQMKLYPYTEEPYKEDDFIKRVKITIEFQE